MDKRKKTTQNTWDDGAYGTGRTCPPKTHSGMIALLLILVIFLSGIITVLGLMNVRLFRELSDHEEEEENALSISFSAEEAVSTVPPAPAVESRDFCQDTTTICLQESPKSVSNVPKEGGLSLQEIYEKNIPSVVSIRSQVPGGSATGTGVIVSSQGYIVTNCHVVQNAKSLSVLLSDDRMFPANLVGQDPVSDLAVLFIEAENLDEAEFGDSAALRVGDAVAAIGDPLGIDLRGTMTDGIVSAINRDVTTNGRTLTLIQTNAALNSGNSGGPLINCYGQVIGINTMKIGTFASSAGVEGLGFAIPSTTVKEIVDQIIAQGYVSGRPTLELRGETLSKFYQHYYRLPAGLFITEVTPGSQAQVSGIAPGDILLAVDDTRVITSEDLEQALYAYSVGDTVTALVYSGGQKIAVELTLTESRG